MIKKIISTTLLALLPMGAVQADNNITKKHPFANPFANDPFFQDFERLQSDMDKLFENFHKQAFSHMPQMRIPSDFGSGFSSTFKTDVHDKGDHYEIVADLPGMDKAKINVKAENGMLSIDAQSETKKEQKEDDKVIRQERFVGSFHRSMSLPEDANEGKMTTKYKDGVLTIKIPKLPKKDITHL